MEGNITQEQTSSRFLSRVLYNCFQTTARSLLRMSTASKGHSLYFSAMNYNSFVTVTVLFMTK